MRWQYPITIKYYVLCVLVLLSIIMFPLKAEAKTNKDIVFIGDSRFVGMYSQFEQASGDEVISYANGVHWICKSGENINSYRSTINNELLKYYSYDTIIVYELGVNDLSNISNDIAFVRGLENKGYTVYVCDILPVNDEIYSTAYVNNDGINKANAEIEKNVGNIIHFSNTVSKEYIWNTNDGLHYSGDVYLAWYKKIMHCINKPL